MFEQCTILMKLIPELNAIIMYELLGRKKASAVRNIYV